MQYDELTADEQSKIDVYLQTMRPLTGQIQRAVSGAVLLNDTWQSSVSAVVAKLDVGAMVPNQTGLAGAESVSREDIENSANQTLGLLNQLNTDEVRQRAIRMAGLPNTIG